MKKNSKLGLSYSLPINIWLTIFFLIPILIILSYSFLKRGTYGGVEFKLSFETFSIFVDKVFLTILFKISELLLNESYPEEPF